MAQEETLEARRKRLMWRASRRGIKEMDILVGGFAAAQLQAMDETQLTMFEKLLDIPDQDLLSYATHQMPVPAHLQSALLEAVLAFRPDQQQ
jgi:antitoxin CptB